MEEKKFFIAISKKRFGPYDIKTIKMLVEKGRYTEDDLVYVKEIKNWMKAKDFPPFREIFIPTEKHRGGYFVNIKNEVKGPLQFDELKALVTNKTISPEDAIWDINRGVWIKADKMPEVAPLFDQIKVKNYHISIGGRPVGPYTDEDIKEMILSGEITIESYIFDGNTWLKIKDSTDFSDIIPPAKKVPTKEAPKEEIPKLEEEIPTAPPIPTQEEPPPPPDEGIMVPPAPEEVELKKTPQVPDLDEELIPDLVEETPETPSFELDEIEQLEEITEEEPLGADELEKEEVLEEKTEKEARVPEWLRDYQISKVDVGSMNPNKAFAIPTSMIDEDSIDTRLSEYGGFTRVKRIFSAFIDGIILGLGFLITTMVLTALNIDPFLPSNPNQYEDQITLISVYGAFFIFYLLFRDGFTSYGSFGKKISGIILIQSQKRRPCGIRRSFLRNIIWFIPPLNIIDMLIAIFSKRGRRLGDRLAGTEIIEAPLEGKPF
ncbi:MAG: hypothetical protein DRH51_04065 [Candidatus Coatesbacteria bacterium]|nr:MAG: hypothetical protein DRH51_04065 [Candidatus Coatesbacteria bacterium]RLC43972.1 MAG: hypothetical protein DRH44_03855 [Candidatus Coatesbacteria bacterium]